MHSAWKFISSFFRGLWYIICFIKEFVLTLFALMLLLIGVGIYSQIQSINQPKPFVKGALLIDLSGTVVDQPDNRGQLSTISRELLGISGDKLQQNSLFDLVDLIRQAKNDNNISGIVLQLNNFVGTDQSSLEYIGKALKEFRATGKPIYAIGDSYSQGQYYLASFANKIYMSPEGSVSLYGFATNSLYYHSLLERLKVSTHVFRVGKFKSAVEPYLRDNMSPEAKEQDSRWLDLSWKDYITTVANNRNISTDNLVPPAKNFITMLKEENGDLAQYALHHKLVDDLATRAQVSDILSKEFGWNNQDNHFNCTSIYDYALQPANTNNNQIAVLFAQGMIVDGTSNASNIVSGDTLAAEIKQARLDPKIKAVILRINSPGGSVAASEVIRDELLALKQAGKPLVVSMGGVAASGGYWISTPADYVIASPSTLTGSIGIYGIVNTFEQSLQHIGVYTDGVNTSPLADMSTTKALNLESQQLMQLTIDNGYQRFLDIVASARHKTTEQINDIAQGHVWIGSDAKNNGLVDQLGDFDDAVTKAAELAHLAQYQLNWYSEQPSWISLLANQIASSVDVKFNEHLMGALPKSLLNVVKLAHSQLNLSDMLQDPQNRYAICLECSQLNH